MDLAMVVYGQKESEKEYASCHELQHYSHDHPLTLLKDINYVCQRCRICQYLLGSGWVYSCKLCYNYSIHKLCAELPKTIRNWLHTQHHLELLHSPDLDRFDCDGCDEVIFRLRYSCTLCDFDVDLRCALSYIFKESQGHDKHSFVLLKPTFFTCDACGIDEKEVKRFSRVCSICQIQVHRKCSYAYLPTVTLFQHCHKLKPTFPFQIDFDFAQKFCKLCFNKMNNVLFMYYCSDCSYIVHSTCAWVNSTPSDDKDDNDGRKIAIGSEEYIGPKDIMLEKVKHFSHPHDLIVGEYEPRLLEEVCDGCARQISVPFYTCAEGNCNFYLHKHCFELRRVIQHPLHAHPLTLSSFFDLRWKVAFGFVCYGCKAFCNGFAYICEECKFFLDVGCSLLLDILVHEGHQCTLTLIDMNKQQEYTGRYTDQKKTDSSTGKGENECNACNTDCSCKYLCEGCNFELCLHCASLPITVLHDCPKPNWNVRPQKLMYAAIEDGSGEYYCDTCEERRGENHWYYYCEDCKYSTHSQCIFGSNLIKYGKRYLPYMEYSMDRAITLKKAGRFRSCGICKENMKDSPALHGADDVYFHFNCYPYALDLCKEF